MQIGDCVVVERGSVICATSIGSNVHIGRNVIIGNRCIIRDNSKILNGAILPPDTVVPPYGVFGGQPATFQGELHESIAIVNANLARNYYYNFVGITDANQQPQRSQTGAPTSTASNK